ncbi:MAG: sulfite exporter TauE/SafE family protein [Bacteroidales bacterium]
MLSWLEIVALIVSGVFVGFINTLAGGGTIISISIFLFLGLPIDIANGTNRIAVILQNITSVSTFRKKNVLDFRKGTWLALPAVIGSVIGAQIAVDIQKEAFEKAFAVVMIIMIFFLFFDSSKYLMGREDKMKQKVSWMQMIVMFLIGLYGGFVQVGVGYFLLAAIVLGAGYDLVRANAIKVWIVLLYTPFTLVVFLMNGAVNWQFGLIHAIGNILGAYIASHMAIQKGVVFVKWVIIVVILITSAQLFGLYKFNDIYTFLLGKSQ